MKKCKPIDLMHHFFGEKGGTERCATCCNLKVYQYGSKSVRKCIAYGGLHSSKADWAKYWHACGLYSTPVTKQMVSDVAKRKFARTRNANAINVCSEWKIGHVEILMDSEVRKSEP